LGIHHKDDKERENERERERESREREFKDTQLEFFPKA
jgi:hypothetical protein